MKPDVKLGSKSQLQLPVVVVVLVVTLAATLVVSAAAACATTAAASTSTDAAPAAECPALEAENPATLPAAAAWSAASCALGDGKPKLAEAFAANLGDGHDAHLLRARIAAANRAVHAAAIELVAACKSGECSYAIATASEYVPLFGERELLAAATWAWFSDAARDANVMSSADYFARIGAARGTAPVSARAAAADPGAARNRIVDVIGAVTGAYFDREHKRTVLRLEAMDVTVANVGTRTALDGRHEEYRWGGAYLVTDTHEVGSFAEQYAPSGLSLNVTIPRLDESLVNAPYVRVVGLVDPAPDYDVTKVRAVGVVRGSTAGNAVFVDGLYAMARPPRQWEQ